MSELASSVQAHCIADWGRGYRAASYSQLHKLRAPGSPMASVPWIAVTATATPRVQAHHHLLLLTYILSTWTNSCEAAFLSSSKLKHTA